MVREAGVEPARPEWTLEPESSESTNSTTRAYCGFSTARLSYHKNLRLSTIFYKKSKESMVSRKLHVILHCWTCICRKTCYNTFCASIRCDPLPVDNKHLCLGEEEMEIDLRTPTAEASRWNTLSPEEKIVQLYENQKNMLEMFLKRNAITRQQYDKGIRALETHMHA